MLVLSSAAPIPCSEQGELYSGLLRAVSSWVLNISKVMEAPQLFCVTCSNVWQPSSWKKFLLPAWKKSFVVTCIPCLLSFCSASWSRVWEKPAAIFSMTPSRAAVGPHRRLLFCQPNKPSSPSLLSYAMSSSHLNILITPFSFPIPAA